MPILDPQQARLRTLLPTIQTILLGGDGGADDTRFDGFQIGPLIAGPASSGLGREQSSRTLFWHIFLLDNAFRVGEYIPSGRYVGTVESFSLRSVKLGHHRGPLFTIPFGELGAIQNYSRDWATDKFNITVGYDTDIDFARS